MLDRRVLLVLAVTIAVVTGCSKSDGGTGDLTGLERNPPTTHVGPADAAVLSPDEVVQALVTGDEDLRPGERAVSDAIDARLEGTFSLTYCGAPFDSNANRQARRAVTIAKGTAELGSNEAVLYQEGGGEEALAELRDAVAQCQGVVEAAGDVPQSYRVEPMPAAEIPGLLEDHVAQAEIATPEGGTPTTRYRIYQRRGDALVITTSADKADATRLATNAAGRLRAMAPEPIGA